MYCYTQVKGAVVFIEEVEPSQLKMDPQQFQRYQLFIFRSFLLDICPDKTTRLMDEMSEEPINILEKRVYTKKPVSSR